MITTNPGTLLEVTMSAWEASLEASMRGDTLLKRPFDEDEDETDEDLDLDDEDEDEEDPDEDEDDYEDEDEEEDFAPFGFDEDDPDA